MVTVSRAMSLAGWLRAPRVLDDADSQRLHTLHTLLIAGCAILLAALAASIALRPADLRGHFPYAAMLVEHVIVLAITRRGRLRTAAALHATCYSLVVFVAMVQYGGVRTPAGFVLPPMVMLMGLTWSARAALVTALSHAAMLLLLVVLENTGVLRQFDPPPLTPARLWIVATGTLLISAVILHVALGIIRRSQEEALAQEKARRAAEERLAQSRRLEAIGQLAAGVAHDFNNVLQVVFATSDQLTEHADPEVAKAGRTSLDAAEHGAALTRQLLAFGRRQLIDPRVIDVNQALRKLETLARGFLGEDVRLVLETCSEPAHVRADGTQLEQVVMNLLTNARDAMPRGGRIHVRTRTDGEHVLLEVEDDGVGMAPDVVEHLFEPFFTTKDAGRGTGLGLATVHGIVEQCGGRVEVESQPGNGARFTIVLPLVHADEIQVMPPRGVARAAKGSRVLMVDDDEHVRSAVAAILQSRGHGVTTVASAAEALESFAKTPEPPSLLLTDVVMPDMPGTELAQRLRERAPGLRVLFMSGYAHDHISVQGVAQSGVHFIAKPFAPEALLARIDAVLAGDDPGSIPTRRS